MPEERKKVMLGQLLVEQSVITEEQLNEALDEQKVTGHFLGEVLVGKGMVSEERIAQALSEQLGFPYFDLTNMIIEPKAIELVPREMCIRHKSIPIYITDNTLTVAMTNPLDVNAIDEIQIVSGLRVQPVFACFTAIRNAIEKNYGSFEKTEGQVLGIHKAKQDQFASTEISSEQIVSMKRAASLAPVIEMVNNIITRAVEMNASDIHLEPEKTGLNCRYRIDGVLYPVSQIPLEHQASVISRIKIMASMDIAEKRLPQDGRMRMFVASREVDLRVSTFPTIYGENLVMRILDRSSGILDLPQLGFSKDTLELFSELIKRPYGMFLLTGPTGSGKTSTLYAALSKINSLEKNIVTLEDPIEYEIPHIRQSQVNIKAGLSFASGLRSIVRQDPDIIMIGEIRDKDTADIAIHAALTGHLVFSTLHTNDAPSAATRLIDMGVEPFLVASSLIGILAQRLVRTLCKSCAKPYKPSDELIKQLGLQEYSEKNLQFYMEVGCKKCKERGYLGRTAMGEILIPNDKIKELITRKTSDIGLREEAIKNEMKTLRENGLEKVMEGVTSVSEVLRVTEAI